MAHQQQKSFCLQVLEKFPEYFIDKNSLDIGSLDINGNNRFMFNGGTCIGIDIAEGKNVDVISKGHELTYADNSVDVIISTECFEHDMYYDLTLKNIIRMLKPGGIFLFTCASTGRPEHGTLRTSKENAPLLEGEWANYYKNLTEEDIRNVLDIDNLFSQYEFSINNYTKDLYFYGIKN